jgi:hypothetical protein
MERTCKITHISQLLPEELRAPVRFDDIDLTEEEKELALSEARVKKHDRLEDERKRKLAEIARNDFASQLLTPNGLYGLARYRATQLIRSRTGDPSIEFEPTEHQKPIITALSLFFTNHEGFESLDTRLYNSLPLKFSLNKGIWLWGNPGVGKTLLMEMFNRNNRICYEVIHCPKLAYDYIKNGDEAIERYTIQTPAVASHTNFHQKVMGICFNDLGVENTNAKHYGNPINVIETIVLQGYENRVPYWQRFVTTNLTFDQVRETYGVRFLDRVKECYNIMDITGESLRK